MSIVCNVIIYITYLRKYYICFRKIISTFGMNNTILKSFIPIFYEETKVLSELLRKYRSNSNECNIMGPISRAIMDMIGRTALGLSFNTQQDGHHRFVENIKAIINVCFMYLYRKAMNIFFQIFYCTL